MARVNPQVSDAERDVLKMLWEHGPQTVRDIKDRLQGLGRQWAHTTVITLLGRLAVKGYVTSDKSGFAHIYQAAVSRDELVEQRLSELADQFCEGAAGPLVLSLVKDGTFSPEELRQLQQLIDELDSKQTKKRAR